MTKHREGEWVEWPPVVRQYTPQPPSNGRPPSWLDHPTGPYSRTCPFCLTDVRPDCSHECTAVTKDASGRVVNEASITFLAHVPLVETWHGGM